MNILYRYIATLGFVGYMPFAPGTCGTLTAFILYVLLKPSDLLQTIILILIMLIGIISSGHTERLLNDKDSSHIVIDEFCGYFASTLFIPFSLSYAVAAFFLFRVFDILKPFPIRKIETAFSGGTGIMADDIMAAIYTNLILQIWFYLN